jgi:outer membrane lipoprotein LolB
MHFRLWYFLAAVALLPACASLPPEPQGANEFMVPADLALWSASGKFSFRGPEGRESGQFYWNQDDPNYLLRLIGPLGVGAAEVERNDEGVNIRVRGDTYQGENTNQLFYELTGIWAPLENLPDILLGRAPAETPLWQVRYDGVIEGDGYRLPQKLTLTSDEFVLQVFISRWSI